LNENADDGDIGKNLPTLDPGAQKNSSTGAIIGGVVGGVVALVIGCVLAFVILVRLSRKSPPDPGTVEPTVQVSFDDVSEAVSEVNEDDFGESIDETAAVIHAP
jgi:hypothetical protein